MGFCLQNSGLRVFNSVFKTVEPDCVKYTTLTEPGKEYARFELKSQIKIRNKTQKHAVLNENPMFFITTILALTVKI